VRRRSVEERSGIVEVASRTEVEEMARLSW